MMRNHMKSQHPFARVHGTVEGLFRSEEEPVLPEPIDELFSAASQPDPRAQRGSSPQKVVARCFAVKSVVHVVKNRDEDDDEPVVKKKVKSTVHVVQKNDDVADLQKDIVTDGEPVPLTEDAQKNDDVADLQNDIVTDGEPVPLTEDAQKNDDVGVSVSGLVIPAVRLHKCGGAFPPLGSAEPEIVFVSVPTLTTISSTSSFRKISDQHLDLAMRTVEFSQRVRCSVKVD